MGNNEKRPKGRFFDLKKIAIDFYDFKNIKFSSDNLYQMNLHIACNKNIIQ